DRPGRRPRGRRRRLRREAVLAAGAGDAGQDGPAPGEAEPASAGAGLDRTARDRRGATRGAARRRAPELDREGVRSALVPRLEREPRLLARPADSPRLGLLGRARALRG